MAYIAWNHSIQFFLNEKCVYFCVCWLLRFATGFSKNPLYSNAYGYEHQRIECVQQSALFTFFIIVQCGTQCQISNWKWMTNAICSDRCTKYWYVNKNYLHELNFYFRLPFNFHLSTSINNNTKKETRMKLNKDWYQSNIRRKMMKFIQFVRTHRPPCLSSERFGVNNHFFFRSSLLIRTKSLVVPSSFLMFVTWIDCFVFLSSFLSLPHTDTQLKSALEQVSLGFDILENWQYILFSFQSISFYWLNSKRVRSALEQ